MKHAFLYLFVLVSFSLAAQTDKHMEKIKERFKAEEFKQVVDYKRGKTRKLEAEAIFYMARAHFMLDNDEKAIQYCKRAIKKGPATANMHYL